MAQNAELSWLAGKWVDKEKPQYFLDFSADGKTYLIGRSGQVGSAGDPDLPYPTSCCYEFVSRDFDLIVKKEKNPKTGTEYTGYYLNYQYSEVRLVPNCDNSANCHKYIERANAREEVGWVHTLEFVRFEDSIITNDGHTYYK